MRRERQLERFRYAGKNKRRERERKEDGPLRRRTRGGDSCFSIRRASLTSLCDFLFSRQRRNGGSRSFRSCCTRAILRPSETCSLLEASNEAAVTDTSRSAARSRRNFANAFMEDTMKHSSSFEPSIKQSQTGRYRSATPLLGRPDKRRAFRTL